MGFKVVSLGFRFKIYHQTACNFEDFQIATLLSFQRGVRNINAKGDYTNRFNVRLNARLAIEKYLYVNLITYIFYFLTFDRIFS